MALVGEEIAGGTEIPDVPSVPEPKYYSAAWTAPAQSASGSFDLTFTVNTDKVQLNTLEKVDGAVITVTPSRTGGSVDGGSWQMTPAAAQTITTSGHTQDDSFHLNGGDGSATWTVHYEVSKTSTSTLSGQEGPFTSQAEADAAAEAAKNAAIGQLQNEAQGMVDTGIITVHNGKGGKDRLVPVHNSVIEYLRSYSAQLPDEREWFFPSACGHYSIKTIYDNFRELLFACNIPHTGNGPRVHDFRHTFAVHTLEKQLSDGYDPMVIVPRLAAYLGHKSYRETCWYIHLTVASFPELSQKLDRAFVGIIPVGGETDEEN